MIRKDLDSLPAYVPGARMENALKLSSNEMSQAPLDSAVEAMTKAAAGVNRYPDMGATELKEKLAAHLGVDAAQVAVGTGSSALCMQLVVATSQPGDEVVYPWRSFEAYPIFVKISGATGVPVPLKDERLDLPAMAAAVTDKTKLIFICNPNNPTGTTITTEEFSQFMEQVPADVIVALDEAYFEYNTNGDTPIATEAMRRYPNVIGLRTFSKAYGLAGIRVGYAFGAEDIIAGINKVAVPFSVSSVAQAAAIASLEATAEFKTRIDESIEQRTKMNEHFSDFGSPESFANFVWLPAEKLPEEPLALAGRLAEEGVLVRAFPEGVRITTTTAEETERLLSAWDKVVK